MVSNSPLVDILKRRYLRPLAPSIMYDYYTIYHACKLPVSSIKEILAPVSFETVTVSLQLIQRAPLMPEKTQRVSYDCVHTTTQAIAFGPEVARGGKLLAWSMPKSMGDKWENMGKTTISGHIVCALSINKHTHTHTHAPTHSGTIYSES